MRGGTPERGPAGCIALAPLGRDQRALVAHIAVAPEQEAFCGTIAGHFDSNEPECDFNIITRDGAAVGFFKIDRAYATRFDFAHAREIGLRGVMIDRAEQGRGTGTAAMRALRPYLARRYPEAQTCVLTVNTVNVRARAAYLAGGFHDSGALHFGGHIGPQHILRLCLRPQYLRTQNLRAACAPTNPAVTP